MALMCQKDSHLRELDSRVLECKASSLKLSDGKVVINGYDVVLEDTILFPEGGGQNSDHGTANGNKVLQVTRNGSEVVHFLECSEPLQTGDICHLEVDWTRRFDNMQQHSGQHLMSAILENDFDTKTLSWWMAENEANKVGVSYIQLDKALSVEQLEMAEAACNDVIQRHVSIQVKMFQKDDPSLSKAHTRGLPDNFAGPIRVVTIEGVDNNMCCGTHLGNTAQLQCVKFVSFKKSKKENFVLNFLVGNRVLAYLKKCLDREEKLNLALKGGPEDHVDLVTKAQRNLKLNSKAQQILLKELADREVAELDKLKPKFYIKWRKEGNADYINQMINNTEDKNLFLCLVVGDDQEDGQCHLSMRGSASDLEILGKQVIDILEGKGGGKGTRINAKVSNLKKLNEVEKLLLSHFSC